jgi:hypothetical protein
LDTINGNTRSKTVEQQFTLAAGKQRWFHACEETGVTTDKRFVCIGCTQVILIDAAFQPEVEKLGVQQVGHTYGTKGKKAE